MKKLFLIFILFVLFLSPAFCEEGKTYITKEKAPNFNFDLGLTYISYFEEENSNDFGLYSSITFSPNILSTPKINPGLKIEGTLTGLKTTKQFGAGILVIARLYIKKSFELIGGMGARYMFWDLKTDNINHAGGLVIQGGARGRLRNWFAVGLQLDYFKGFGDYKNMLLTHLFVSFEK